ncbi:MAG: folylpolyglutamate synthase/dihydrofolate synthase family protein [Bacteroidales bacterium]
MNKFFSTITMTYSEVISFLYNQLPVYQKNGQQAYKNSLSNIIHLCDCLGNPQNSFKSIHIGGTNGKGSVSHMCASVLQESGYKTGLYTSPHFIDFRERIRINGECISENFITDFVQTNKKLISDIEPSFFEITVALAFYFFAQEKVDIAVIEVGLGGRLDSTNIIAPIVACITNIDLDHTQILGTTHTAIAHEKAGIIKAHTPIIIGEQSLKTQTIFEEHAHNKKSSIIFANTLYTIQSSHKEWHKKFSIHHHNHTKLSNLSTDLTAIYQQKNICTAYAILTEINKTSFTIPEKAIHEGFKNIIRNTHIAGRWHIIKTSPFVVCDVAHNYAGIKETMKQLSSYKSTDIHIVWGMVTDKDVARIIPLLPTKAHYHLCKPNIERGMTINHLKTFFDNLSYTTHPSVIDAYISAYKKAGKNSIIYIGGSTFVVSEFLLEKNQK